MNELMRQISELQSRLSRGEIIVDVPCGTEPIIELLGGIHARASAQYTRPGRFPTVAQELGIVEELIVLLTKGITLVASYHQTLSNTYLFCNGYFNPGDSGWLISSTDQREGDPPYLTEEEEKAIREKGDEVARNGIVRIYNLQLARNLQHIYPSLLGKLDSKGDS